MGWNTTTTVMATEDIIQFSVFCQAQDLSPLAICAVTLSHWFTTSSRGYAAQIQIWRKKVYDHNVPVRTVTFCLFSLTPLPLPHCVSPVMRGSTVSSGDKVPWRHRPGRQRSSTTCYITLHDFPFHHRWLALQQMQVWRGTEKQHRRWKGWERTQHDLCHSST